MKKTIKSFFTILLFALLLSLLFNFNKTVNDIKKGIEAGWNDTSKKEMTK